MIEVEAKDGLGEIDYAMYQDYNFRNFGRFTHLYPKEYVIHAADEDGCKDTLTVIVPEIPSWQDTMIVLPIVTKAYLWSSEWLYKTYYILYC